MNNKKIVLEVLLPIAVSFIPVLIEGSLKKRKEKKRLKEENIFVLSPDHVTTVD